MGLLNWIIGRNRSSPCKLRKRVQNSAGGWKGASGWGWGALEPIKWLGTQMGTLELTKWLGAQMGHLEPTKWLRAQITVWGSSWHMVLRKDLTS